MAAALLVGLALVGTSLVVAVRSVNRQVDKLDPADAQQRDLLAALVDQETGVRGYALAGTTDFLGPYRTGRADQQRIDADLRRRLRDEPHLVADLDRLERAARDWQTQFAEPLIIIIQRSGGQPLRIDSAAGQQRFDRIRAQYQTLRTDIQATARSAKRNLDTAVRVLVATFVVLILVALTAALLTRRVARRWVLQPLARLGHDVTTVSGGELDHPIEPSGPTEVDQLGRQVEQMRRRIVQELAAVTAAEQRLVAQAQDLARSNADLEQFAYVASHDLQEPLRKVASFCQMLERRYGDQLDDRGRQYIDFAVDGAKRMQVLINDLLAFSRVGRVDVATEPVDLGDALDDARSALSVAIEESGATITADPLPTVLGDRALLAQLFQNLIGNAIKFRGDRSPTVRVGSRSDATGLDGASAHEVWVADDGIGIEPEYAERVFVIFQRLHPRERYTGTGIGLALCKRIVEHHGGTIWLDTDAPTGTTIRFTFPEPSEPAHARHS